MKIEFSIQMITLKLQYSNFDEGEFTEEQPIDYTSFIEMFDKEANDRFYTKYSWTINNNYIKYFIKTDNAQFMVIEHISKDVYSISFAEQSDKYVYGNNFYDDTIKDLCKLFFDNAFLTLKDKLGQLETKTISLINQFKQIDYTYSYIFKKKSDLIFGSIYFLTMAIIFLIGAILTPMGINIPLMLLSIGTIQ